MRFNLRAKIVIFFAVVFVLEWVLFFYPGHFHRIKPPAPERASLKSSHRLILIWTKYRTANNKQTWLSLFNQYYSRHCIDIRCVLTDDRELVDEADAIIFHLSTFRWSDIPKKRYENQRYIFYGTHTPLDVPAGVDGLFGKIPHFFNWTMLYTHDSDVYAPRGEIINASNNEDGKYFAFDYKENLPVKLSESEVRAKIKQKTKLAAWVVQTCTTWSKREKLALSMQHRAPDIDIYGPCGKNVKSCATGSCNPIIDSTYYFYLAFETSICPEYITEEFYGRIISMVVPIVLNGAAVKYLLPEHSFIAADDFDTPESLVWYLKDLAGNHTAYMEYFAWRKRAYPDSLNYFGNHLGNSNVCQLCKMLHMDLPKKSYADAADKWWTPKSCAKAVSLHKWSWQQGFAWT